MLRNEEKKTDQISLPVLDRDAILNMEMPASEISPFSPTLTTEISTNSDNDKPSRGSLFSPSFSGDIENPLSPTISNEQNTVQENLEILYESLSQSIAQQDDFHLPSFREQEPLSSQELKCGLNNSYQIRAYQNNLLFWFSDLS
ncbi:MAG TPA: hypothetical protein VHA13_03270, partial [Gammaproteobacteria bacterium]|nr:hypothetical protein [Gammaproteobacteria bacterium]